MKIEFNQPTQPETGFVTLNSTELPSKGKQYPYQFSLQVQPYKVKDVLTLSSSTLDNLQKYDVVLAGITTQPIFDLNELTLIDAQSLALIRYSLSVDNPIFKYSVECPFCNNANSVTLTAEDIALKEPDFDYPIRVGNFTFGLPTLRRLKEFTSLSPNFDETELLLGTIALYETSSLPIQEVIKLLQEISLKDFQLIETFADKVSEVGVQPKTITCKSCSKEFQFLPEVLLLPL